MKNFKTVSDLNDKIWYRLLKVSSLLFLALLLFLSVAFVYDGYNTYSDSQVFDQLILDNNKLSEMEPSVLYQVIDMCVSGRKIDKGCNEILEARDKVFQQNNLEIMGIFTLVILAILGVFEFLRRAFYYILLGRIRPKK
jgi:hypothetical protein